MGNFDEDLERILNASKRIFYPSDGIEWMKSHLTEKRNENMNKLSSYVYLGMAIGTLLSTYYEFRRIANQTYNEPESKIVQKIEKR